MRRLGWQVQAVAGLEAVIPVRRVKDDRSLGAIEDLVKRMAVAAVDKAGPVRPDLRYEAFILEGRSGVNVRLISQGTRRSSMGIRGSTWRSRIARTGT